jgi:hypothetical protein
MQKSIGWASVVGFFGLLAAADAQAPPSAAAGSPYDGTYRMVSSANVNATYTTRKGLTAPCPSRRVGLLHIVNGKVRYTTTTGYRVTGTIGPQGELAMQAEAPSKWGSNPIDLSVSGTIDGSGTVRVRQLGHSCSYDFVWQKVGR